MECQLQSDHHFELEEDVRSRSDIKNYSDFEKGELFRGEEDAEVESIPTLLWEEGNDDEDDQALYPW